MKQKIYQVDAFAEKVFTGNPAAVCPLTHWHNDVLLQQIAMENNLSETAFYVKEKNQYQIRWFTPTLEVDLCGHATLAAAFVLFNFEGHEGNLISFYSLRSGILEVKKEGSNFTLNFPADEPLETDLNNDLLDCFNIPPIAAYRGKTDYLLVFEKEEDIKNIIPNYGRIAQLKARGVIITAKGNSTDFVSRFFAPQSGVTEDPVTGSAHTTLTPYWAKQLQKNTLTALQLSQRTGYLKCSLVNDKVEITGAACLYMIGEISI